MERALLPIALCSVSFLAAGCGESGSRGATGGGTNGGADSGVGGGAALGGNSGNGSVAGGRNGAGGGSGNGSVAGGGIGVGGANGNAAGGTAGNAQGGAGGTGGASGSPGGGAGGKGGGGVVGSATGGAGGRGAGGSGGVGTGVVVDGPRVLVGGRPFHIRGVCWNPVPKGKSHPEGLDFAGFADRDIPLMTLAGINVVRTYEPLTHVGVLDKLHAAGIYVLDSVYVRGGDPASVVSSRVMAIKNHPAILMWVVGNEWNYNGLYVDLPQAQTLARLNEAAALLRAADPSHPIATVYGELPSAQTVQAMPNIDVWGINAYRGLSFGDLFSVWRQRSAKPMFLAEYGADAHNATRNAYDPDSQAMAVRALTQELADQSAAFNTNGVTLGGSVFEWADEWWKDSGGSVDQHEIGGIAPGGGPYPDQTFNEEWFGLVDVDRQPRAAYDALKAVLATLPK